MVRAVCARYVRVLYVGNFEHDYALQRATCKNVAIYMKSCITLLVLLLRGISLQVAHIDYHETFKMQFTTMKNWHTNIQYRCNIIIGPVSKC